MAKITAPVTSAAASAQSSSTEPPKLGTKEDFSRFKKTSKENALKGDILTLGPQGDGKTVFAATGSAFWPEEAEMVRRYKEVRRWALKGYPEDEVPRFKPIYLEDMVWLAADTAPLAGMNEMGIVVPHVIDFQEFVLGYGAIKSIFKIDELLRELIAADLRFRFLVFDTVSSFDKEFVPSVWAKYENDKKKTMDVWQDVAIGHRKLRASLKAAAARGGANLHTIGHAKATGDAEKLDDGNMYKEMRVLNEKAQGKEDINFDITGKSANLYKGHGSFQFVIQKEEVKKKPKIEDEILDPTMPIWWAYTKLAGWETKNRFMAAVKEKQPANLRTIFQNLTRLLEAADG